MIEEWLIPVSMGISAFLTVEYARFRMKKQLEKAKNELKHEAEAWLNSEKGQKAIYTIGVLLGNAIKQGVGLNPRSGKFKWEDIIGQAIAGFIQQKIPIIGTGQGEVSQPYG